MLLQKRIGVLLFVLGFLFCTASTVWAADSVVNLEIDGLPVVADAPPYITDTGRTMVPLRLIMEYSGALVEWEPTSRLVTVQTDNTEVLLTIDRAEATVNGVAVALDAPAVIRESRTMVPVRFIMEQLGAEVNWDAATRTVQITLGVTVSPPVDQPVTEPAPSNSQGLVTGYYYNADSYTMLAAHTASFDTISRFAYKIFGDGAIKAKTYTSNWAEGALPLLQAEGIPFLVLITDFGDPSPEITESVAMLADSGQRAAAVTSIVNLIAETGAAGVDIDFEKVNVASRDNFTAFIRELKAALPDKIVALSLPPKGGDNETWLEKFDYAALASYADRLHIMFYDEHYGGSEPGPVASLGWMRQRLDYLLTLVPKEKLHAMLGAFGRSWGGDATGTSIHIPRALEIAEERGLTIQRHEEYGVPYLIFDDNGVEKQVWFEDAQSMGQKAALARSYGVAGIGVWRMGIVPDDVWQSILTNFLGE